MAGSIARHRSAALLSLRDRSTSRWTSSSLLLVLTTGLITTATAIWGEKITLNDGLGWDGATYAAWTRDFPGYVIGGKIGPNGAIRVLPSGIVHYGLRAFGLALTNRNIIRAFTIMNAGLLIVVAWLWCQIARELELSLSGRWLGAACLFGNFALLKVTPYYPVLTDVFAMALSAALLLCYLRGNQIAGALLTFTGAFVWPGLLAQGIILQVFPRPRSDVARSEPCTAATPLAAVIGIGLFTVLAGFMLSHGFAYHTPWLDRAVATLGDSTKDQRRALVAAAGLGVYLFLIFKQLLNRRVYFRPGFWPTGLNFGAALVMIAFLCGRYWLLTRWPQGRVNYTAPEMLCLLAHVAVRLPSLSLVAHVVYFGPVVILTIIHWPAIAGELHRHGPALVLATGFGLLLAMDPESRHVIHLLPLLVPFVLKAMEGPRWSVLATSAFLLISLVGSRLWYTIGGAPDTGHFGEFPAQNFFMVLGPWMSVSMYFVQGAAVLISGAVLAALFARRRRAPVMPAVVSFPFRSRLLLQQQSVEA
jgi:hypothetical protein